MPNPVNLPGDFRSGTIDFGWDSFDEETKLTKCASKLKPPKLVFTSLYGPRKSIVHDLLFLTRNKFISKFNHMESNETD